MPQGSFEFFSSYLGRLAAETLVRNGDPEKDNRCKITIFDNVWVKRHGENWAVGA